MKEVAGSKETEVLFKKIDDILISVKDLSSGSQETGGPEEETTLGKKIDDLQHYVASLSTLEEKFGDLLDAFAETKEIVGIIVRQLDDIERKYNKTLEDVNKALEMVLKVAGGGAKVEPAKTTSKAEPKEPQPAEPAHTEETSKVAPAAASIDELIDSLLKLVRPQTNADRMSRALEDTRDKLTALVPGHTPVLYQFGKIARELKSYPPTATLNENDIARLNREIRGWAQKLKELAKSN
jgi:ABC-type transporter Mla subunit MlaD